MYEGFFLCSTIFLTQINQQFKLFVNININKRSATNCARLSLLLRAIKCWDPIFYL